MLTQRQINILTYLYSSSHELSSEKLANILEVSEKTIQNDTRKINSLIQSMGIITYKRNKGYQVDIHPHELDNFIQFIQTSHQESLNNRTELIILVLAFEKGHISMDRIAEKLFYSKTVISNEFEHNWRIRRIATVSTTKGIKLNQSETDIRLMLAQIIRINPQVSDIINIDFDYEDVFNKLSKKVKNLFNREKVQTDGQSFYEFVNYLFFMLYRIRLGFTEQHAPLSQVTEVPKVIEQIKQAIEAENQVKLNQYDLQGLTIKYHQLNFIKQMDKTFLSLTKDIIQENLFEFTQILRKDFNMTLNLTHEFEHLFSDYINSLYWRLQFKNYHVNFSKRDITKNSLLTTHIIRDYFSNIFNMKIPDPELAYLIPFFSKSIEKRPFNFNIVLVSNENLSFVYHWIAQLNDINYDYTISNISYCTGFEFKKENYNPMTIYLTTETDISLFNRNIIKIDPILNKSSLVWAKKQIDSKLNQYAKKHVLEELNGYNQIIQNLNHPGGGYLNTYLKSRGINDYNSKFKIIINQYSALAPAFISGDIPSTIQVIHFDKPMKDKNRDIEYLILSEYNLEDNKIHSFYELLRELMIKPFFNINNL